MTVVLRQRPTRSEQKRWATCCGHIWDKSKVRSVRPKWS